MSIFDDAGAAINTGISAVQNGISAIQNGIGAVQGAITAVTGAISSVASALGGGGSAATLASFPLPNPLFAYASYDYLLGLSSITQDYLHNPDSTYRAGQYGDIIAKSASIDPNNRVDLGFGQFEFYIDDLVIESQIGHENGNNTSATGVSFRIIEPYSMGMFFLALQKSAQKNQHLNWNVAPFLLTVNFRGNTETGKMENIANTDRQMPIRFSSMDMVVTEQGAIYNCTAIPYNQIAITDAHKNFLSDQSARGKTVGEILQWGDKSLEAVLNKKLQDVADANGIAVPDKILILFPKNIASGVSGDASPAAGSDEDASSSTPTTDVSSNAGGFLASLGVSQKQVLNKTVNIYVQDPGALNDIGLAKMGFDELRKADAPMGGDQEVWDETKKVFVRSKNGQDPQVTEVKFSQDTDIVNAINQVILTSTFVPKSLDPGNITAEGYKKWWHVDTQLYLMGSENAATGLKPRLLVYRVLPYDVHVSSGPTAPNEKPPGYEQLNQTVVKEYNYIYTGKNVDVLKFEIKYQNNFMSQLAADATSGNIDVKTAKDQGGAKEIAPLPVVQPLLPKGAAPSTNLGTESTAVAYLRNILSTDKLGGGGVENEASRAGRMFFEKAFKGTDMIMLDMEIIGDPYFFAQSGTGNYTAQPKTPNLNADGTVNWQGGEVDIRVNFRTPFDINLKNGTYDFGGTTPMVTAVSGMYKINTVTNRFSKNEFKQTLHGQRRILQSAPGGGTPAAVINADQTQVNTKDPNDKEKD